MMRTSSFMLTIAAMVWHSTAQAPPIPSGITVVPSKVNPEVNISYKQIVDVCETTAGTSSFSGFVHIPGSLVEDLGGYNMSTYFMYFEARNSPETAPLAIYLAGGPGESSSYIAFNSESGPCIVNKEGTDTSINPWSFNNHVNMLYIDQPTEVGFSYSSLIAGTLDISIGVVTPGVDDSTTGGQGIFSDQSLMTTANTTVASAKGLWVFLEHWLSSFPEYDTSSKGIGFWGQSYAGLTIPETAATVSKGLEGLPASHPLQSKDLSVDTIGVTNGCLDFYYIMEGFLEYANNNTYGVKFLNDTFYEELQNNITKPGGCLDLTSQCREAGQEGDPDYTGNNSTVNEICAAAVSYCSPIINAIPDTHDISPYDIADINTVCAYSSTVNKYLNQAGVLSALGVPLNWTWYGAQVLTPFASTGDALRQSNMPNLEYLLDRGVKVSFIYGDRDSVCPGTGMENVARLVSWSGQHDFVEAGFQEVEGLSASATGGVAKQHGQFSVTRVFESGHQVSAYSPEMVFTVFNRTMVNRDVITGSVVVDSKYSTEGPHSNLGWRNPLPGPYSDVCMVEGQFYPSADFAVPDYAQ